MHPVLLPLAPQQLPPRHTPLEQELPEVHMSPSDFLVAEQLPPDKVYPELHPSQDPDEEQSLQLLSYPLQQRLPCAQHNNSEKRHKILGQKWLPSRANTRGKYQLHGARPTKRDVCVHGPEQRSAQSRLAYFVTSVTHLAVPAQTVAAGGAGGPGALFAGVALVA